MVAVAVEKGLIKKGDKVIVPAIGWSTSYFPFLQYGIDLIFVDVDRDTWNIRVDQIEDNIADDVKGILAINILGNPCNYEIINSICNNYNLLLFEDNCESMGAKQGDKYCGGFGDIGTFSTFFSHHIQTMEGGVVVCDDYDTYQLLLSLRSHGWTRGTKYFKDNPFEFVTLGYNVRPGELNGTLGSVQLNKLDDMNNQRIKNAETFIKYFGNKDYCRIQKVEENSLSSWFGFGIVFEQNSFRERTKKILADYSVDCRPICTGNFYNQPVCDKYSSNIQKGASLASANNIEDNGLFLGNNPMDLEPAIKSLSEVLDHEFSEQNIINSGLL
jgi:CDP-6-deoxy-D-xylo-4-hexulose-3-dehydrase